MADRNFGDYIDLLVDIWPVVVLGLVVAWAFPAAERWHQRQQARQQEVLRERTRLRLRRLRRTL